MNDNKDYSRIVIYDTETVDINPPYIISIAYLYYENGKRVAQGYEICNPDYPISSSASQVNGFTNEMVQDNPKFNVIWDKISKYFTDSVWIGHNSDKFDQRAMRKEFQRYGIIEPHHYNLDTLVLARNLIDKSKISSYKLSSLCEYFKYDFSGYHSANVDTYACMKVYSELCKLMTDENRNIFIPKEIQSNDWSE